MDDLFEIPEDPGLEFVLANGRTYSLRGIRVGGQDRTIISWSEPGGRRGVVGGFYINDAKALEAIEQVEARRAQVPA